MSRSRIEIQNDVNKYRAAIKNREPSLNDPTWDHSDPQYISTRNIQNEEKRKLIELEQELAKAKARGEKGRSPEEIRKDIDEAQLRVNESRSILINATNPMQIAMVKNSMEYFQCTVNALELELNEANKEKASYEKAKIEELKKGYEQEINSNPNNAEVYIRRGEALFAQGMADGGNQLFFDSAIADFTKAIKLDSKAKDAYFNRAGIYSQKSDYDRAIADYDMAIQINPNNEESYAFRGGAFTQKGKYDKALADFKEAIRLNPKYKNAYAFRGLMYFNRCVYNKEKADYDKAVADIDNAIVDMEETLKLEPGDNAASNLLNNMKDEKKVVDGMKREQQNEYDRLVQKTDNASTEKEYQDLARQLRAMSGFRNTAEIANKCDNRYQELKKERECREAEETAKREAEKKKKRLIGLLAAVIVVAVLVLFIVYSQTRSFFYFQQNAQGTITVTGYSGKKQVVLPATEKGVNVTEIGNNAFNNKKLTSVTIPDGITIIGENAFRGNRLTSVVIPDSVTIIGDRAFFVNQLTSVTIGNNVTSIGEEAFSGNYDSNGNPTNSGNQLTSVTIPDSVIKIGQRAFRYNQLLGVTIGNNVETIGNRAFSTNKLTRVTIPNSVTSIEEAAFIGNQLTDVVIGNKVITIGDSAFNRNSLASITIPNSVTSIGFNAFAGSPITSIRIGTNVKLGSNGDSNGILGDNTGFNGAYANNGRRAGNYTRSNANSASWTRR